MSPSQKKQRISAVVIKHAVSTTDSGEKLQNLLTWLKSCGTKGLEDGRFNFIGSDGQCGGSLGGFAAMDYAVGDLLFAIPLSCILSLSNSRNSKITNLVRDAAKAFGEPALVTSELLIWLCMIQHLDDSSSHFNTFLQSLDSDSPSPLSWPKELAAALLGTNMSTMTSPFTSVQKHSEFLNETRRWAQETNIDCSFLSPEKYNVTSLIWARGHYLARRYPGKFSININTQSSDGTEDSESNNIEEDTISKDDGREPGMMNLGALVPLLDILNHDPEREWLTFKVLDGFLHVTCNYPVAKGSELYSNYGSLSNEMLLHAYGFCLEKNDDDAVTLQLMGVGVDPVNNNTTGLSAQFFLD